MKTPKIALIAMDCRDPAKAFVRVPDEPGRWVLTDRCVVEVECTRCKAAIGEPCKSHLGGYRQGTHCDRRNLWNRRSTRDQRRAIHVESLEKPRYRFRWESGKFVQVIEVTL